MARTSKKNRKEKDQKQEEENEEHRSKEVLKDIWIKPGNNWGVDDIMKEDTCNQHHRRNKNTAKHTGKTN